MRFNADGDVVIVVVTSAYNPQQNAHTNARRVYAQSLQRISQTQQNLYCPDYTGVLLYVYDDEDVVLHLATHEIASTCHS